MDSRIDPGRILDILELQRLKALYFYFLDHKDWDSWRSLFIDEVELLVDRHDATGAWTDVAEGLDLVMAYVKTRLVLPTSVHHGHTPLFEFDSDSEARGVWAMSDVIYTDDTSVFFGYGHYRETYRKEAGAWKFGSVHLTRLKIDVASRPR